MQVRHENFFAAAVLWSVSIIVAGVSCSGAAPTSAGDILVEPIQIDSVDVLILETATPRVVAHISGVLGDGCSEFHSLRQERSGSTVIVTISRKRPRNAVCTQIAKLYDDKVPLTGQYPPGAYLLQVNDTVTSFTTP